MASRARSLVYRPLDAEEVAEAILEARRHGLSVTARGAGLSYGDAALNQGGVVVDVSGMRKILLVDEEKGVVRAEAGATIADLCRHTLPHGWWPPVVPGTMHATLGGCVAMNVHGKNHAAAGAMARHLDAVTLVTGEGELLEVRNEGGLASEVDPRGLALADVVGAQGLTGTLVDVTLRLRRVRAGYLDVEATATRSLPETLEALDRGALEADYTVGWLDCTGYRPGRAVVHHAWHIPRGHPLAGKGLEPRAQSLPDRVAGILPARHAWWALRPFMSRPGIRVLNSVKYHGAALRRTRRYTQTHAGFHFLLDYLPNWKRAYGAHGLLQYQMFVPAASANQAFAEALREQKRLGVPSYLAVVKRHITEDAAASYAVDGYSLAMDFAVGRGERFSRLMRLCRSLGHLLESHGGRLYAAKDAVGVGRLPVRRDPTFSSNLVRRWERTPT